VTVEGFVLPGFESVRDAFESNFTYGRERGAAFAALIGSEIVVHCWGGLADRVSKRPWTENTVVVIFSGTKGLVAACILLLIDRGQLNLDDPICRYWPEFAANGKAAITVRDCLSHAARLPGIVKPTTIAEITDSRMMASVLADQAPSDDPRAALVYHALTFGWICDELVRRTDGRSIAEFFDDEFARPMYLDIWIGLPDNLEQRVAALEPHFSWPADAEASSEARDPLWWSINANPPVFDRKHFPWNSRSYHAAGIPAAGAIASAKSMAEFYAGLPSVISRPVLEAARTTMSAGIAALTGAEARFGIGFQLQVGSRFGPAIQGYGHVGAGGSVHGAWPDDGIAFSYATNLLRDDEWSLGRAHIVLDALYRVTHEAE
jgi:CubicO group peptidase (beta-lactamase class C family)